MTPAPIIKLWAIASYRHFHSHVLLQIWHLNPLFKDLCYYELSMYVYLLENGVSSCLKIRRNASVFQIRSIFEKQTTFTISRV